MSDEDQNGPGFYYVVRWRRHDLAAAPTAQFDERPVDSRSNMAVVDAQSVYKPYEIYVLAVNDAGDAVSPPRMLIGYSSEDGPWSINQSINDRLIHKMTQRILTHNATTYRKHNILVT